MSNKCRWGDSSFSTRLVAARRNKHIGTYTRIKTLSDWGISYGFRAACDNRASRKFLKVIWTVAEAAWASRLLNDGRVVVIHVDQHQGVSADTAPAIIIVDFIIISFHCHLTTINSCGPKRSAPFIHNWSTWTNCAIRKLYSYFYYAYESKNGYWIVWCVYFIF